jgi:hypothetical protein
MDIEKLTQLRTKVNDLSEATQVEEYRNIVRLIGDIYKEQIAGVLNAGTTPTLATEQGNAEADIAALASEMNFGTNALKK